LNIANISLDSLNQIHTFIQKYPELSDEEIREWMENNDHKLSHCLFALETIWSNCCDPDSKIIELKPEIQSALTQQSQPPEV
jgi:hypothetical protein